MDLMNVLVVERGADWSYWNATTHLVGHAMLVLVQQVDETTAAFRRRIRERLSSLRQGLGSLVLLRGRRGSRLTVDDLVRGLAHRAPKDVRTFSAYLNADFSLASTAA